MCGICFICSEVLQVTHVGIHELLLHRGPDVFSCHGISIPGDLRGIMQGCVLHLRGELTPQPLTDYNGNALLWNGEIFGGIQVKNTENDTQVLFDIFVSCTKEAEILHTLQSVQGPWAFIYWQADANKLWFGRDVFGRRSLLWHLPSCPSEPFILSSVACGTEVYTEIPSVGIFCLTFSSQPGQKSVPALVVHPWHNCTWPGTTELVKNTQTNTLSEKLCLGQSCHFAMRLDTQELLTLWISDLNPALPGPGEMAGLSLTKLPDSHEDYGKVLESVIENESDMSDLSDKLINILENAVQRRVETIPLRKVCGCPRTREIVCDMGDAVQCQASCMCSSQHTVQGRVAILFSGGLDSAVLAALVDRCLPPDEPIDLLNVAFEQDFEKKQQKPKQKVKKKRGASPAAENLSQHCDLIKEQLSSVSTCSIEQLQVDYVSYGTDCDGAGMSQNVPGDPMECSSVQSVCSNEKLVEENTQFVTIYESEKTSIDTAVDVNDSVKSLNSLSLSNDKIPRSPKDASLNVSVSNNAVSDSLEKKGDAFDVPDRRTGKIALGELNPLRKWNFVEINVSQEELRLTRESHIRKLITPLCTVLDDSIGCALWFASRGAGQLRSGDRCQPFCSVARVLLCGMAADEQFAGYSRHRVTYQKSGWQGVVQELNEEITRISARNLGRDDRIITDHGKESRFPYLDENVTQFISTIPVYKRANLDLPRGVGEKLLLRLAALKLGLVKTACQPKRAIQFGSKIAKLDKHKEKGSDVCSRLS